MQQLRRTLRDQKETPLQRAVWWVEFVARNKGASQLRSPGLQLRWWELFMLDVLGAVLAGLLLAAWLLRRLLLALLALLCGSAPRPRKQKTH